MKSTFRFCVSFLGLSLVFAINGPTAFALPGDNCPSEQILWGPWIFNRQFTMADGCLVQATPLQKPGLVYREYVFDETGRFMVFNSIDGPYETSTSQRNFMLLPAIGVPTMQVADEKMIVRLASGHEVQFRKDSLFVEAASDDLSFADLGKVDLSPGGNFEIEKFSGVLLDTGWVIGDRSSRNAKGQSRFVITGEKPCTVVNDEIFAFVDPVTGEQYYQPVFKFPIASTLESFLVRRCGW